MRMSVWRATACALLLGCAERGGAADIRLAMTPVPFLESRVTDGDAFAVAASLWFHESLAKIPGLTLVPDPRNSAIFQEINGGAWEAGDESLHGRYSRYEPVAAVVVISVQADDKPRIDVDTAAGRQSFSPATTARAGLMKELGKAAAFLAGAVKLDPPSADVITKLPDLDGEAFSAICQAHQTLSPWPRNSGESRLLLLQPVWKKNQTDPRLCAEVVRSATVQVVSKSRDGSFTSKALNMAKMALPPVLGTPFEDEAFDLAKGAPAVFIPELKAVVSGFLKEAEGGKVSAALDDALTGKGEDVFAAPAPSAGGAWASGSYSRPQMLGAVRVLARLGDNKMARDLADTLGKHPDLAVRQEVVTARAATNAPPVQAEGIPAGVATERLMQLANDPYEPMAAEARRRLADQRPPGDAAAAAFDLRTAQPFRRLQILERLAQTHPAWEESTVEATAADNPDPYTRAAALTRLAELAPAKACRLAVQVLQGGGHRWLRLYAASVLAAQAGSAEAGALPALLASAKEPAVRLYLEEALARAGGKPAPLPRPAARPVDRSRNLSWLCGMGQYGAESPFDAYYCLSLPGDRVQWKKGYDAGKIFFVRISTVGHPGLIVLSRLYRDRFWRAIEQAIPAEDLPLIDGLVFGEETMSMSPEGLWKEGWRPFCEEMGIDPARVDGKVEALSATEVQAWQTWAYDRAVDGFNILYEYVRKRYARERPGLQVCTFLPGEPNTPGLRRWKFDVGGIYDYKCDSRMSAYNLVRRMKTLWPDRPVIWLSLGIGGYEMNPVKCSLRVPDRPMNTRRLRCYADAVAAWMAGADTGWFSIWIFVDPHFSGGNLSGIQVGVEDIGRDSELLRKGADLAFKGATEAMLESKEAAKAGEAEWDGKKVDEQEMTELVDLVQGRDRAADAKADVDTRKANFRRGFLFYQQYVYDCARVFKSLPRLPARQEPVLAVYPGANVWTTPPTPNPVVPGMALVQACDFLSDLKDAVQLDLSAYRVIMVRDPGALPSAVVGALSDWLEKTEGLLYIQGGFEDAAEWGTPADHDGRLERDWPWKGEVQVVRTPSGAGRALKAHVLTGSTGAVSVKSGQQMARFTLSGPRATGVLSAPGGAAVLAVWRDPARFKGVVVFDGMESASRDYVLALRDVLLREGGAAGRGLLDGPVLHETLRAGSLTAAAAPGYYREASERQAYPGMDLLTGETNPVVGGDISGALTAQEYRAGHVAVMNGISLLAERPPERVEAVAGGLEFRGGGLVRLAGEAPLRVQAKDGAPLAVVREAAAWVVEGSGEGMAELYLAGTNRPVVYVRSARDVSVRVVR